MVSTQCNAEYLDYSELIKGLDAASWLTVLAVPIRLQPKVHEFDIQTVQLGLDSLLHHIVFSTKIGTLDALCVRTCVWSVCVYVCVCKCLNSFFLRFFVVVKLVPWWFGLCLDIICCIFSWLSQFVGHFVCLRLASVSWEVVQCNPGFWKTSLRRDHLSLLNTFTETCPLCFHVNESRTVPF